MSDNEILTEYKIVKDTFETIKNDIILKCTADLQNSLVKGLSDDFFNILDFQILFVNQIGQTYRDIQDDVSCKDKIISNLVKINKDMCEKMIIGFLDKLKKIKTKDDSYKNFSVDHIEKFYILSNNRSLLSSSVTSLNERKISPKKKINRASGTRNYSNSKKLPELPIEVDLKSLITNDDIIAKLQKKVNSRYNCSSSSSLKNPKKKKISMRQRTITNSHSVTNTSSSQTQGPLAKSSSALALRRETKNDDSNNSVLLYNSSSLSIKNKKPQISHISRSMTPNNKDKSIHNISNYSISGVKEHQTFEEKLLMKYHQILNEYNSQKTEEQVLKETKQRYNESLSQSRRKLEKMKLKLGHKFQYK